MPSHSLPSHSPPSYSAQSYPVWSVGIGGWGSLRVRIHVLFIVFALSTIYLAWLAERAPNVTGLMNIAWISLLILLFSGLVHGIGHYMALDESDQPIDLILGPLGELFPLPAPYEPRLELTMQLAGPLANLGVALIAAAALLLCGESNISTLLHPLAPVGLIEGEMSLVVLRLTLWVNWIILLANVVIPTYPFDGGRILRAVIWGAFPNLGRRWAGFAVFCFAQTVALSLIVMAWVFRDYQYHGLLPVWLALILLAVFVYFSARQELARDITLFGPTEMEEISAEQQESEELEGTGVVRMNTISRWLEHRRRVRQLRQQQREAEEERRLDDILRRLHVHGMGNLSTEERAILLRVSHRLRDRQQMK